MVGPQEVTWNEYRFSLVVNLLLVCPFALFLAYQSALKYQVTFREYWNGWEAAARVVPTKCERDGSCRHTYTCDSRSYKCGDSTCHESHDCPYVNTEYDYIVDTTAGPVTIATSRFPENPDGHRFRAWQSVPVYVIAEAGVGPHPFWVQAKERIARGELWPATRVNEYTNYILASSKTVFKKYSGSADGYETQKLLPAISAGITEGLFYRARKAHLVGCPAESEDAWNESVERANAAFGGELHGDLRLVLVCGAAVNDPADYTLALEAYWQNLEKFNKNALPKNTVVVIIGSTDGTTVSWGRAFTGMPIGNEELQAAVQTQLRNPSIAFTPEAVLGTFVPTVVSAEKGYSATTSKSGGALTDVMWGTTSPATAFKRVSMGAEDDEDEGGGFKYLMASVQITELQRLIIFGQVVASAIIFFLLVAFRDRILQLIVALAASRRY